MDTSCISTHPGRAIPAAVISLCSVQRGTVSDYFSLLPIVFPTRDPDAFQELSALETQGHLEGSRERGWW